MAKLNLIAAGICGLVCAIGILGAGCSRQAAAHTGETRAATIPVTISKVGTVTVDRTLPIVGTLLAKDQATVCAQVEGQIDATRVDFGDRVKKEKELALVDTASYEALANQASANVTKARASALNAENNLNRVIELQRSKISSASEFDSATAAAEQARAEVKFAQSAEAIARLNLERSRVKAPFDGTVSERLVTAGDFVKVGTSLFRIVNDKELKLLMQVPERYSAQIQRDQVVQFSVDAWPGTNFEGKISLISPSISTASRAFNIGARVANPDGKLMANTFARGELLVERQVPTPVVPLDAVINFAGVTKVFVIADGVARARAVKVGRIKNGTQEVLDGLQPGELVAVTGQSKLYEGANVRVLASELPGDVNPQKQANAKP